jgi:hypothetical protein
MKKIKVLLSLLAGVSLVGAVSLISNGVGTKAMDDFVDSDGDTHYGWSLVANETNKTIWDFGDDGMVNYCRAAEGDTAEQRVYNYALRNLAIEGDDSYSVECTFAPDADSDLSAERCYGLVTWYQDADNFLIYWLQQKTTGDWSGQFYGRIDGSFRKMYIPESAASGAIPYCDYWRKGEYYDMWWDQDKNTNPELLNKRNILLTQTVTLKVVSTIEDVTVNSVTESCRRFDLHQIVNGVDFVSNTMYIEQLNSDSGDFYTGLYSECFSVGVSDFKITPTKTNFSTSVTTAIDALPATISSKENITAVKNARQLYSDLLSYKSLVSSTSLSKLEVAETGVGSYVDGVIEALDNTKSTFVTDVNSAYELYSSLTPELQAKVTKLNDLIAAVNEAKDWVDPNTSSSSSAPISSSSTGTSSSSNAGMSSSSATASSSNSSSSSGGCGGAIVGTSVASIISLGVVIALFLKRKKHE